MLPKCIILTIFAVAKFVHFSLHTGHKLKKFVAFTISPVKIHWKHLGYGIRWSYSFELFRLQSSGCSMCGMIHCILKAGVSEEIFNSHSHSLSVELWVVFLSLACLKNQIKSTRDYTGFWVAIVDLDQFLAGKGP